MCKSAIPIPVCFMLVMLFLGSSALAQEMSTAFTYQGKFSDAGLPAQGDYDFIFALYYTPDAPTAKHFNRRESVPVEGGYFTVELNYGYYLFGTGDDFWLGVRVRPGELEDPNEFTELLPRQKLTATPYAIYARKAGEVAYGSSITGDGTTNYLPKFTGTFALGDSLIYEASGNIGIGTTNPDVKFDVHNSTSGGGIYTESTSGWAFQANTYAAGGVSVAALSSGGDAVRAEAAGIGMAKLCSTSEGAAGYFNGDVLVEGGNLGIGTTSPGLPFDVERDYSGYLARIKNTSTGLSADVLALQVGTTGDPGTGNDFIKFLNGSGALFGSVEGNGGGGISYTSSGGDFAEWLMRLDSEETLESGDVVGVFGGKISRQTKGADHVLVISAAPIVLGNTPDEGEEHLSNPVAFIGQAPVKVTGRVHQGDYIIPSGGNDGIGIAVAAAKITAEQFGQVIGKAWESSDETGVKKVNVAVGLTGGDEVIQQIKQENDELKRLVESLLERVEKLEKSTR